MLTERYSQAVEYARAAHDGHKRKGTGVPYFYHLIGVSSLVMEFGGDEYQAIAALLHDVLEDCGAEHRDPIRRQFGDRVADIVDACTDGVASEKAKTDDADPEARYRDWLARKQVYLASLAAKDSYTLLVPTCDKLHNARAIVQDLRRRDVGIEVFSRFKAPMEDTLRYYDTLAGLLEERVAGPGRELRHAVDEMHACAGQRPLRAPRS